MQWWYGRRSLHLQQQVKKIQDELLQEIFAIRRDIELAEIEENHYFQQKCKSWLTKTEQIHESLNQISHDLSPCYLEESLPLAIQYEVERQIQQNSALNILLDLPNAWPLEALERSRAVLGAMNELLQIALPNCALQEPIHILLQPHGRCGKLSIELQYQTVAIATEQVQEWRHLQRSFQLLTSGWCQHQRKGLVATWCFCWPLN